jgi:hypothetical protein
MGALHFSDENLLMKNKTNEQTILMSLICLYNNINWTHDELMYNSSSVFIYNTHMYKLYT